MHRNGCCESGSEIAAVGLKFKTKHGSINKDVSLWIHMDTEDTTGLCICILCIRRFYWPAPVIYHIMWPVSRANFKKSYPALDSAIRLLIQPGDISLRWRSKRSSSFSDYWEGAWTQSASESDSQSKPEAARAFQNPRMLAARILKQERRDSCRQPSGHKVRYNRHGPIPAGRPAPCIPKFLFVNRFMIQGYTGDG